MLPEPVPHSQHRNALSCLMYRIHCSCFSPGCSSCSWLHGWPPLLSLSAFYSNLVHYYTHVVQVKYWGKQCDSGRWVLHQFSFPLGLCHLCKTMRTKRVLRALSTLLCALCALGGGHRAGLGQRDGRHIRCETRNANIMVAFCGYL